MEKEPQLLFPTGVFAPQRIVDERAVKVLLAATRRALGTLRPSDVLHAAVASGDPALLSVLDLALSEGAGPQNVLDTIDAYNPPPQGPENHHFDGTPRCFTPEAMAALHTFAVHDAHEALVGTVDRPLTHTSGEQRPPGGSSGLAVNAKPILLEVDRDGRRERQELVPAHVSLPFKTNPSFLHPGKPVVEFRLFQKSRPIQVITVRVQGLAQRGTPIRLEVTMRENSAITVRGSIGEEAGFDTLVEVPPPRTMPGQDEVEALSAKFDEVVAYVPSGPQNVARTRWTLALRAFGEARERGDTQQAVHEFEELEELVAGLSRPTVSLEPPKHDYDTLVREVRELIAHLSEYGTAPGKPFSTDEVTRTLEAHRVQGERAYQEGNQRAYGEAVIRLRSLESYLQGLLPSHRGHDLTPEDQARGMTAAVLQTASGLVMSARALVDRAAERELREIRQQAEQLAPRIATDPHSAIQGANQLIARLRQIETRLQDRPEDDTDAVPLV
ncbi:hypothetical protein [Streptomyces iconiensis]|uniref:Uncharacterized protein n=1 Tax=Streptomyces iconiensis TaxID=1384038 RepID=A0ABT6ZZQ4_9ACTN|nr:hypothetical protein [Streptomyces iconiensis]MDJ1134558.1 hypothetical protein [Streptomyces iconiensis]